MRSPFRLRGFTLLELMVVILVINILIMLLLPAVQQAREAARRAMCRSNLTQISIALWNYHDSHRVLPPGTVNATGPIKPTDGGGYHMSWLVQLLPYLEQSVTYSQIDFSQSAYSATNTAVMKRGQLDELLTCPSEWSKGTDYTSYAGSHHHTEAPIDTNNTGVFYPVSYTHLTLPTILLV